MAAYSVNEIIEMAVQIERNGYAFYNEAAKRKDLDDDSRKLITWLRDAELDHEKTFCACATRWTTWSWNSPPIGTWWRLT